MFYVAQYQTRKGSSNPRRTEEIKQKLNQLFGRDETEVHENQNIFISSQGKKGDRVEEKTHIRRRKTNKVKEEETVKHTYNSKTLYLVSRAIMCDVEKKSQANKKLEQLVQVTGPLDHVQM